MNCPKCQKPLPKGAPRVCPNCKKDLTNFYKLLEKRGEPVRAEGKKPLGRILLIAALACLLTAAAVLLIIHFTGGSPEPLDMEKVRGEINASQVSDFAEADGETDYVKLTVRDFGEIVVRLRPDAAPISARNFKDLVAQHYYDGTVFHRIYPGFMIQGGAGEIELDPIKGEFSANGIENPLLHIRGVLSMARTSVKDSATSQFFLMHGDDSTLDGNYAAFGYIVAGLDVVDRICSETPLEDNPYNGEHSVPQTEVVIESAVFVTPK